MKCPKCRQRLKYETLPDSTLSAHCYVCGFYAEKRPTVHPPRPVPPVKVSVPILLGMCHIHGCEGEYQVGNATMPLCKKHRTPMLNWLLRKAKGGLSPAPYAEINGRWGDNPDYVTWVAKGRPNLKKGVGA